MKLKFTRHLLSSFINQRIWPWFRKFLNRKRVEVMENFNKPEWQISRYWEIDLALK
jgi:hypothetical protein